MREVVAVELAPWTIPSDSSMHSWQYQERCAVTGATSISGFRKSRPKPKARGIMTDMGIEKQGWIIQLAVDEAECLDAAEAAINSGHEDEASRSLAKAERILFEMSPGVPAALAAALIGVSEPTVRDWTRRGILSRVEAKPMKLSLSGVYCVRKIVKELRRRGQDADFRSALLAAIDDRLTLQEPSLQRSLHQMREGKRKHYVDQR